ncbi:PepSY domain-containing protein [Methylophilus sp. 3sh_L]|uniref:PepSY domain-containing protein n=1 Tax=Methylophilus sp. 3sh_L TaxID=3377114 RepID=UPI00398F45BD
MKKMMPYLWMSLLLAGTVSQHAWADDDDDDDDMQKMEQMVKTFGLISQQDAQTKALAAKPGVVKEIELERRKFRDGWDYEVEIVDANGKEWEVMLDAKTGKVNSVNRDWF